MCGQLQGGNILNDGFSSTNQPQRVGQVFEMLGFRNDCHQ